MARHATAAVARPQPRKPRRDVLATLEADGRLDAAAVAAAHEIRAVWEALSRRLFPRALDPARPPDGVARRGPRTPFDGLDARTEALWRRCYKPWADAMSVEIVAGISRTTRLQLVLDVVVDNWGLRQLESRYRLRHGTAIEHLRAALARYGAAARSEVMAKGKSRLVLSDP